MKTRHCVIFTFFLYLISGVSEIVAQSADQEAEIAIKVEALLEQMTLEEKVGQMRIFHSSNKIGLSDDDELVMTDWVKEHLEFGIAGIKNPGVSVSPKRSALMNNQLQKYIIEHSRLGIPALFIAEAYHGVEARGSTVFGRPINMAATWNSELVQQVWDVTGREARIRGLHMCHSPEADIVRDPRFGRMSEAYGEDTHLTTEMVVAAVKGVQGDFVGLASTHIGAVTKHFAGYGQVDGGRNFASVQISERVLADQIFPPFKAAVQRAHTLGIMASHGDLNGVASHSNRELLTDVLREDWGFKGYTVSDANDIARLFFFMGVAESEDDAALLALRAGMDVDLYSEDAYSRLPRLARENSEILPLIDQAVRRVLRVKFILGLFDDPYIDVDQVAEQVRSKASLEIALKSDLESIILLKNENDTLPLDKTDKMRIALVGPLVGKGTLEAFQAVMGDEVTLSAEAGFELTNKDGETPVLRTDEENMPGLEKAVAVASDADVVIMYLGGDRYTAKEAYFVSGYGDRASIDPVGLQDELLERVKALGKPVIVVLKHRRTLSINVIAEKADAILDIWDLSERGDEAVAKMIVGEVSPSGKLPVTVPRSIGKVPFHYSQNAINFKKDYLFVEEGDLYPFGYGLSYSEFEYSDLSYSTTVRNGESFPASVRVTNTGTMIAKEVVQLYIQDLIGSVSRPRKELKRFQKIELAPGESMTIVFEVTPEMLAFTGIDMQRNVENGDFILEIGTSSVDVLSGTFTVVD